MNYSLIFFFILFVCNFAVSSDIFNAIELRDKKSIYTCLRNKPDLEVVNKDGQSVLIKAVQSGNVHIIYRLLHKKVSVNKIDNFGKTALDYAVESYDKNIVKILIKFGAKVTTEAEHCRKSLIKEHRGLKIFLKAIKIISIFGLVVSALYIFPVIFNINGCGFMAPLIPIALIFDGIFFVTPYCISRSIEKEDLKVSIL